METKCTIVCNTQIVAIGLVRCIDTSPIAGMKFIFKYYNRILMDNFIFQIQKFDYFGFIQACTV